MPSLFFAFLVETEFHHIGQAGLELLTSEDLPALASQSLGITGISCNGWLGLGFEEGIGLSVGEVILLKCLLCTCIMLGLTYFKVQSP